MKILSPLKNYLISLSKNIVLQLISFGCIIMSIGIAYAAWTTLSPSQWATGQPITQTLIQGMINNLNDLDARVTALPTTPTGWVIAFNLSSCPAGWIAANGNNGTPDLRGEFIRGLDSGRGVDAGRALASSQRWTLKAYDSDAFNATYTQDIWGDGSSGLTANTFWLDIYKPADYNITNLEQTWSAANTNWWLVWFSYGVTRPRNVALLYCIKQ